MLVAEAITNWGVDWGGEEWRGGGMKKILGTYDVIALTDDGEFRPGCGLKFVPRGFASPKDDDLDTQDFRAYTKWDSTEYPEAGEEKAFKAGRRTMREEIAELIRGIEWTSYHLEIWPKLRRAVGLDK